MRIRVLRDETYSALMTSLGEQSEAVAQVMKDNYTAPLAPGTIIEIDESFIGVTGKVYFFREDVHEDWYLPKGWYEVLDD